MSPSARPATNTLRPKYSMVPAAEVRSRISNTPAPNRRLSASLPCTTTGPRRANLRGVLLGTRKIRSQREGEQTEQSDRKEMAHVSFRFDLQRVVIDVRGWLRAWKPFRRGRW